MSEAISNPQGLGGYTDLQTLFEPRIRPVKAASAITALSVVHLNTTLKGSVAATDGVAAKSIGIALNAAATGEIARVVVWGPVEAVPIAGDATEGAILKRSVTTAGRVSSTATPAVGESLGWAIAAASASNGTVSVFVNPAGA